MGPIKVLLAKMRPLQLLNHLLQGEGVHVIEEIHDEVALRRAARQREAQVIIMATTPDESTAKVVDKCEDLFNENPNLRILVLPPNGDGVLYQGDIKVKVESVSVTSITNLLQVIREMDEK